MSNAEPHNDPIISLENQVLRTFEQLGYPQLQGIACESDGDRIRLSGKLDSFYLKQVAQSVAVKVIGVTSVDNQITVE
jgi:osmotically-inducible protein OsmY